MRKRVAIGAALLVVVVALLAGWMMLAGAGRGSGETGGEAGRGSQREGAEGLAGRAGVLRLERFEAAAHREDHPVRKGMPLRFAEREAVAVSPATHGCWESVGGMATWRLRVEAPGALNLNFGFSRYALPGGASLEFRSAQGELLLRPLTSEDNEEHGQLWTPVMAGGELEMRLTVAEEDREAVVLNLESVNRGFRELQFAAGHEKIGSGSPEGNCHVDVVCSAGESGVGSAIDLYRNQIRSAGVYTLSGVDTCSGAAVSNVRRDGKPYFLTADHCGVRSFNAASMVVYWNHENSVCRTPGTPAAGGNGDGPLVEFNSGAIFRMTYGTADVTLVELDDPIAPEHAVYLAGWSRSGTPTMTACVHHPAVSEKRISFDFDPVQSTADSETSPSPNGTHWRVVDWEYGSTEGGSSGAPLFDQGGRLVGQLTGGFAACGNNESDWYGKFARGWIGGGSAASALSSWLDPDGTGAPEIDGFDPSRAAIRIVDAEVAEGDSGVALLEFEVSLGEAAVEQVTVGWSTVGGTGEGGTDFTAVSGGQLSFGVGEDRKVVAVEILGDLDPEEHEEFVVRLAVAGGAAYLADGEATGMILNDDYVAPVVTGPATVNGSVSEEVVVGVETLHTPTGYSLSGAPAGMTIEAGGVIRWLPDRMGEYEVTVTASNPAGSGSGTIKFVIAENPLVDAMDLPAGLALSGGGAAGWSRLGSAGAVRGEDEARSGMLDDEESSWIEVELDGPDYLGFWWAVSSEEGYDELTVSMDGRRRATVSGEVDWDYRVLAIPPGRHAVRWTYQKDGNLSAGADEGRVDFIQVASRSLPFLMESPHLRVRAGVGLDDVVPTFQAGAGFEPVGLPGGLALDSSGNWSGTPGGAGVLGFILRATQGGNVMEVPASLTVLEGSPVGTAVNQPGLGWTVTGDGTSEWHAQSVVSRDGLAAKERNVGHGEEAEMSMQILGPGEMSFWWKVSSEEGYDELILKIDGEFQDAISGEVDWERKEVSLPYGRHKVSWIFSKDDSVSEGLDTGWVDQVAFGGYTGWVMAGGLGTRMNVVLDPDRDGQALLLEYATGGRAMEWDAMPAPALVDGHLEWEVAKPAGVRGVMLDAEVSGDLVDWNRSTRTILQDDAAGFRARDAVGGAGPRFMRGMVHPEE